MKILIYSPDLPFLIKDNIRPIGGITVELNSWIEGFKKNNHRVGILTWEKASDYVGFNSSDIDFVEGFKVQDLNKPVGLKKKSFLKALIAIFKYKPDLIILEGTIDILYFFSFLSRLLNIKFVYRLASDKDSDERVKKKLKGIKLLMYNSGLKNSEYISTQNLYQFEKLKKRFPKKKIFIHYNPVLFNCAFELLNRSKRSYIAWVGNFRKVKNLKALYETAVKCADVHFKIAGTETAEIDEETRKFVMLLKELPNVKFSGYIKRADMNNFLSEAYALLNTSHLEGFSNTFLEAWAVGTPVISTIYVNPDNIINEKSLGLIAKDFDEIPYRINELLNTSNDEYKQLAERCRRYLLDNHDPEILAKEFIKNVLEE